MTPDSRSLAREPAELSERRTVTWPEYVDETEPSDVDVQRGPPWRSVALVAAAVVLVAVASALVFASLSDKVYGARADIFYAAPAETSDDARERILATQQELIRSRAVLSPVSTRLRMPLEDLRAAVTADVGRDDLLRITVTDGDPARAQSIAEAVVTDYLALGQRLTPEAGRGERLLEQRIERLQEGDAPLSPSVRDRVAVLQDRLLDLQVATATRPRAELLSPAYVLDSPLSPNLVRSGALGLMLGLLLATGVAVAMLRRAAGRR